MGVSEAIQHYLVEPVSYQFTGLFDLNGRLGVLFLGISYLVAYGLFRYRRRHGLSEARSFWQFIGGRQVHWHPSARLDYLYYFLRGVLKVAVYWTVCPVSLLRRQMATSTCNAPPRWRLQIAAKRN